MSKKKDESKWCGEIRNWCVGICLVGGEHAFRVFDDYEQAQTFARHVKQHKVRDMLPKQVHIWEM